MEPLEAVMMRAMLLALLIGCDGEKSPSSPGGDDSADPSPDSGDSGDTSPPVDTVDTSPPVDTVDTSPPVDTVDTVDTGPVKPEVDCENLPATPLMFKILPGFTDAEDFTFDGDGNYVAFDGTNLVSIDYSGTKKVLVPGTGIWPAGTHLLADGDIVVCDTGSNSVARMGMDGSKVTILSGVSYPNGITVSVDNMVYVSGHNDSKIYEVDPDTGDFTVIATGINGGNGMAFSPDNQTLYVCSFTTGIIWAIDRDGKGGWGEAYQFAKIPGAPLDGLNVDECGNVYVTEYVAGIVWRVDPDDPSTAKLVAQLPASWIPNMHWGRGVGGFDEKILYVASRDHSGLITLEVGAGSTPQAFVVPK